jgi:hypothetical protein
MKLQLTYQFDSEDELRAHLGTETRTVAVEAPAPVIPAAPIAAAPVVPAAPAPVEAPAEEVRSASDVDGDGMPYDAAVHSDPPSFTADGLWRAKRGKGDEAKAARAAFKAKGGNVAAPAALPTGMPGMPAVPGMPTALPADAPEPVSLDRVIEKITGMMTRAKLTEQVLAGLYLKHSGVTDPAQSFGVFNTNESARANLYGELCEIEPEFA